MSCHSFNYQLTAACYQDDWFVRNIADCRSVAEKATTRYDLPFAFVPLCLDIFMALNYGLLRQLRKKYLLSSVFVTFTVSAITFDLFSARHRKTENNNQDNQNKILMAIDWWKVSIVRRILLGPVLWTSLLVAGLVYDSRVRADYLVNLKKEVEDVRVSIEKQREELAIEVAERRKQLEQQNH
ncbi:hypothetical protein MAR_001242 [Mya arenaria]|uniref:Uncharacterized protein n=1 Tax=Mya arenaria TaxID=6604 RepID=A0ABY7FE05_MYAAR|nr:hypothetical protein MAR_001242 [Mya arenaria]